jgi:XTP/dITP diphosphohydrolase
MNFKFLLATNNPNKVREYRQLFGDLPYSFKLPDAAIAFPPETGRTFRENAIAKALFIARLYPDFPVIGEDSGLVVPFLGGLPGINSARFAGSDGDDGKNIEKLLKYLEDARGTERAAYFVCDIALVLPFRNCKVKVFEGKVRGVITGQKRGKSGFGYDPVFEIPRLRKTFAEMSSEEKNRISHRAIAVRKMIEYLKKAV